MIKSKTLESRSEDEVWSVPFWLLGEEKDYRDDIARGPIPSYIHENQTRRYSLLLQC
jgi:hypothetical protein